MDSKTVVYLVIMLICIIMSAYFSAAETAFSTLNKTRIRALVEKGNRRAALTLKLSEDYNTLLSTILIGNNIVNITLSSLGTLIFISILGDIGATVSTAVITVVVLIFGEISPKSIAKDFPETFAMFSAPLLHLFIWILLPFNFLFSFWKKLLSKIFKSKKDTKMSQEELLMLVDEVEQDGSIDQDEGSLLRNVIEFTDLKAEEILTRRVNLVGFALGTSKEEIAGIFSETKFSRLLAYENDIDHIVGVLHQKDFYTASGITEKPIEELISPPLFIPQTEIISDLLKLFQGNQSHLAVVVDEYGETLGIVTMEDVLEELVGEIWDEHDEIVENFRDLGEYTYQVNCEISPEEFAKFFDVEIETECSTLNGWISEQLEKLPACDDTFSFDRLIVKVVEVDSHRATQVNVIAPPKIAEELELEA
ncbi:MAG: HlyC/CorC family transporter [Clostridia bacterium]|nr:HlyC/CorC family transporter [Clostridia bacterium]